MAKPTPFRTLRWLLLIMIAAGAGLWLSGAIDGDFRLRWAWQNLDGPDDWRRAAPRSDILEIPGVDIKYWGNPAARYSAYASRSAQKPRAVVVHFNYPRPVLDLVKYGHKRDPNRGNNSFGYHFYIGRGGEIVQGAPLSRRTNHIKSARRSERRDIARDLWSGNTIGVSLVGACNPLRAPKWRNIRDCARETPSAKQLEAGLIVIRALQARFQIPCEAVYGHGDLQTDRKRFEGRTLSRTARDGCASQPAPEA
jgi:hypothetical protein